MVDMAEKKYGSKPARIVSIVLFSVLETALVLFIGMLLMVGLTTNDTQYPLDIWGVLLGLFIAFVPLPELFCSLMYLFSDKPKKKWKTVLAILMTVFVAAFIVGCVWIVAAGEDSSVFLGLVGVFAGAMLVILPIIWFIGSMIEKAKAKRKRKTTDLCLTD